MKRKKLRKNMYLIIPIIILLIISLLNMYGAGHVSPLYKNSFQRQLVWIVLGILLSYLVYKIDLNILYKYSTIFYILGIISLFLVLIFGHNSNGSNAWFKLGRFTIQPSEIVKIPYLLFMVNIISKNKNKNIILFLKIIIFTIIPTLLIFLEPDTGVVVMYLMIMFGLIMECKLDKKIFIILFVLVFSGFILTAYLYICKKELFLNIFGTDIFYRIDRLLAFKNNDSYQLSHALVAIGASGITGYGLNSKKLYVPELTTDFVYTLSISNFGYIMGIFIIVLYAFLLYDLLAIKKSIKKYKNKLFISGLFWMMFFQIVEHIFMNLGLLPITGITLPFLSYGGSSIISYFLFLGILLKITTNNSSYN